MVPPWIIFPEITPDDLSAHTRQGRAEPYFDEVWRPFWFSLSTEQKTEYLDHWWTSAAWRDAMSIFDVEPELYLEGDAREFEAYLAALREKQTAQGRSIWSRLLRRR